MAIELTETELNKYWATQIKDQLIAQAKQLQKVLQEKPGVSDCFDNETDNAVRSFVHDFAGSVIIQK
jgi:hypothetical protein